MSVTIKSNGTIVIEIPAQGCNNAIEQLQERRNALFDLINQRSDDFATDTETVYWGLSLLKDMQLNDEQIKKALCT